VYLAVLLIVAWCIVSSAHNHICIIAIWSTCRFAESHSTTHPIENGVPFLNSSCMSYPLQTIIYPCIALYTNDNFPQTWSVLLSPLTVILPFCMRIGRLKVNQWWKPLHIDCPYKTSFGHLLPPNLLCPQALPILVPSTPPFLSA